MERFSQRGVGADSGFFIKDDEFNSRQAPHQLMLDFANNPRNSRLRLTTLNGLNRADRMANIADSR
jgi:hypothetical protein